MGGSVGAACVAAVLSAHPAADGRPAEAGYVVAALVVSGVGLLAAVVSRVLVPRAASARTATYDELVVVPS
jgi:hypothetical protein